MLPFGTLLAFILPVLGNNYDLDSLNDYFLHGMINRMEPDDFSSDDERPSVFSVPFKAPFEARRDSFLSKEPSIRDKEYLEHSSLFGNKFVAGGAGEGMQRLRPDGSIENIQIVKSDILPAYCNPLNPCPIGYTAEDGCLEDFENTAEFSRDYQASQDCICDSEHMFSCPGSTHENEIDALARTFEKESLADATLDKLIKSMEPLNPYLDGEKLPVVAKKAPKPSIQ